MQKKYTSDTLPFTMYRNHGEKPQFYIDNSHPPIIDRTTYEAAQRLQEDRRTNYQPVANPLAGKLRCSECGSTFRYQTINGTLRWSCANKLKCATKCASVRLEEPLIRETFLLLINKLIAKRKYILAPLIEQMETLCARSNGTQQKIYQIDQQLAGLTAQNLALARLHSKGILGSAAFTAQTAKLNTQIADLRTDRRVALRINESDDQLNELRALNERLTGLDLQGDFDGELFREIVQSITPTAEKLRFSLSGGFILTEAISKAERRWKR